MDPRLTPKPSSLSFHSALNPCYNEQDYSASLSHAESLSGNIQSSGQEESQIIDGSSLHPPHLPLLYGDIGELLFPRYSLHPRVSLVEKLLNAHGMFALVLLGPPHTRTHLPFLTDPSAPDTFRSAPMQYAYPIDWSGLNRQVGQGAIENHNPSTSRQDIYGASGPSAHPELPLSVIAGTLSSLST